MSWRSRLAALLPHDRSLRRVQTVVGIGVGLVTIAGGLYSLTKTPTPSDADGEVVAFVHDAASQRAISDAAVEVLNEQDALVSSLAPDSTGRARQRLKEGTYIVRASHPSYAAESRKIQVLPRQTVELNLTLRTGTSLPIGKATGAIGEGARAVWHKLGF